MTTSNVANAYPGQNSLNKRIGGTIEFYATPGSRVVGFSFDQAHHLYLMEEPMKEGQQPRQLVIRKYSGTSWGFFNNGNIIIIESVA